MAYHPGFPGNETINGSEGIDVLYGGGGNDLIFGKGGTDYLYGDSENDRIHGGAGGDSISGGAGDDHLYGDTGNDSMRGNVGRDTFHFTANQGNDYIFDFKPSEDRILFHDNVRWNVIVPANLDFDSSPDTIIYYGGINPATGFYRDSIALYDVRTDQLNGTNLQTTSSSYLLSV